MGGGVGMSVHGSHRVAGDRFQFAMPEVGIGFFPDVGATWFLPRMPGELGTYCALTGERFGIADACAAGLATHRIPSARFAALLDGSDRHGVRSTRCSPPSRSRPARGRSWRGGAAIDRLFRRRPGRGHSGRARPRSGVRQRRSPNGPARPPPTIRTKSPLSLKLALAQVRRGKTMGFRDVHARRIPHRVAHHPWTRFLRGRARRDRRQGQQAALAAGHARGRERGGGRAPFRAARRATNWCCHERAVRQRRRAKPRAGARARGRAGASAAGRGGWCCSCA